MEFNKGALLFVSFAFFAFWVGMIIQSDGEEKLDKACEPVTLSTTMIIKVSTGLTGFTPKWTLKTKKVLDSGCYYFFSTFLFSGGVDDEGSVGGVSKSPVRSGGVRYQGSESTVRPSFADQ